MENFRLFNGKKFGWDGEEYATKSAAQAAAAKYAQDGFDTRMMEQEGKYYVFTRRVVTEIPSDSAPEY